MGYAGKVEDQIEAYDYAIEEVKSRPIPPAEVPPVGGHGNVVPIMNIADQNVNMEAFGDHPMTAEALLRAAELPYDGSHIPPRD